MLESEAQKKDLSRRYVFVGHQHIVFHPLVIDESTREDKRILIPGRTPALRDLVEGRILRICQRDREQIRESDATSAEKNPNLICTYDPAGLVGSLQSVLKNPS